uniref:Methyltransferase domain-containing protein n=1 Tax=Pectinophora gossypiella TaxID=13191 RepID=A0A1E1WKS0_PECGO
MSLPAHFETPEDYFKESIQFFRQYERLFNFANTEILVHKILDLIIIEDAHFKDVNIFDKDFDLPKNSDDNEFLRTFFERIGKFKVDHKEIVTDVDFGNNIDVPVSPKKKHEIVYLANELKKVCEENSCEIVVDFGSGLGYLDQLIYETTNLKVLGVECNENHYVGAKKRQRKYHEDSIETVKYIKHTINEHSDEKILEFLTDKFGKSSNFCISGLHACADLTVDGMNLFLKMADAKALVLMPCCYHKMARDGSKDDRFKNFPISNCLKEIFEENKGFEFLKVPFLRLAAQPPTVDENLEDLVFNLLARATVQLYAHKHNFKLKRKKRKAVRIKTVLNDFSIYLQDAKKGFALTPENLLSANAPKGENAESDFDLEELHSIWRETQHLKVKAAIFILLQNYLQPVIENFVLYDRVLYLQEKGIEKSRFKKIFDEKISPRCLALISVK